MSRSTRARKGISRKHNSSMSEAHGLDRALFKGGDVAMGSTEWEEEHLKREERAITQG